MKTRVNYRVGGSYYDDDERDDGCIQNDEVPGRFSTATERDDGLY